MYQSAIPTRIILAVGVGLLIFGLVFGWVAFSVPDWLQFYERNGLKTNTSGNISRDDNLNDLKKFGLWYKCVFSTNSNDFICTLWNNDAPSFVRVVQVLIPFGLSLECLSLLSAMIAFMSRRAFITAALFSALFTFLSFLFTTIGTTVFATESSVYVDRLRLNNNDNPRRWGMWLQIPNLALSFCSSICFIVASILNWCDYRSMQVTGILSHSFDKHGGSVCKAPSDSNMTSAMKNRYPYQDYPNAFYQANGLNNNNQQNPMNYPPPPSYGGNLNPAYQPTPPGLFGYSRPGSPAMNQMYPHSNFDTHHLRHYMTENSEMDELSRTSRSRRRSRRHSDHRSSSRSPRESTTTADNNPKQTQFIPIPVPYYQPTPASQPIQQQPVVTSNNTNPPMSYIIPQAKQQYIEEKVQPIRKPTNMLTYGAGQPSLVVSNPNQPVYTIAYRANNAGNVLTGPAATTYVTATRNQITEVHSLNNDFDKEDKDYQAISKQQNLKKININDAWTWRKL